MISCGRGRPALGQDRASGATLARSASSSSRAGPENGPSVSTAFRKAPRAPHPWVRPRVPVSRPDMSTLAYACGGRTENAPSRPVPLDAWPSDVGLDDPRVASGLPVRSVGRELEPAQQSGEARVAVQRSVELIELDV